MKFLSTLPLLLIFTFVTVVMQAQTWRFEHTHDIESQSFFYINEFSRANNTFELKSNNHLKLRYKTKLALNLDSRAIVSQYNRNRSRIFLNEANLVYNRNNINTKIGKQIVKWGKLSGVSNLDMANSYDYYDLLNTDGEELGQWGIQTKMEWKLFQLELRYVPNYTRSKLYFQNNAWVNLPPPIPSQTLPDRNLAARLDNVTESDNGKRLETLSLGLNFDLFGFNMRLDYFNGYNDISHTLLTRDISFEGFPLMFDLSLTPQNLRMYNVNVQKLVGDWNMWVEYGLIEDELDLSYGDIVADHYSLLSVGFDRAFLFEDPAKMLKLVGQWRHALWNKNFEYGPLDLDHVLDRCLISDIDYQFNYDLSFSMRSAVSYDKTGLYMLGTVHYNFPKQFSVHASYTYLSGSSNHFFGSYSAQDRFHATIKLQL